MHGGLESREETPKEGIRRSLAALIEYAAAHKLQWAKVGRRDKSPGPGPQKREVLPSCIIFWGP